MKTALTSNMEARLRRLGEVDLIVGIPSFNNERTIGRVIKMTTEGLAEFFPSERCLVIVSDGGSKDNTINVASLVKIPSKVRRIVGTYRGVSGKGSAVKLIFEAAKLLKAKGIAIVDSDLRSIRPEWISLLLKPIVEGGGLTTPLYLRYKYDGFITNQIVYPFTRAIYGKRVRQPIGGDFGMSQHLVEILLASPLWKNPYTPKFGIDVFITHTAIVHGLPVVEAKLGVKIHDEKDPTLHLAPMFSQVVGSMFSLMILYESFWKRIKESEHVPLIEDHFKTFKPKPFPVDKDAPFNTFKQGFIRYRKIFESIMPRDLFDDLSFLITQSIEHFNLSTELWARIAYTFAAAFKKMKKETRNTLLDALRICWSGRVVTFIQETSDLDDEQAERKVVEDSSVFEALKPYIVENY